MQKNILVTGANKGIGLEIVRQLAILGHQVVLTARNKVRGVAAQETLAKEGLSVHFIQMDVNDEAQIRAAAEQVNKQFGQLHVLINNAAISLAADASILLADSKVLQQTMQTNAFSMLTTVAAFSSILPSGGRIINLSSGLASMTDSISGWSPFYSCSKTLVNAFTRHQAFALAPKDIAVVSMCPGWVRTDMGGSAAPRNVSEGADTAVWLATAEQIETGKFYRDRKVIAW
ncbi:MAG: SDR family NAD(P)-dependent oxidoreductase [Bacteroidota bacterium]